LAEINWVSVAPERWRTGVGRAITQAAIDWAKERGFPAVALNTTVQQRGAQDLYRSMGFVEEGQTVFEGGWEVVWFKLPLQAG
jgi:GNAT superfamily N-acetyltransferase